MPSRRQPHSAPVPPSEAPLTTKRALIFISHDTRDADLAEAFENLLTDASGGVLKAFRSSDRKGTSGIEFGAEWYATIMARLEEATDVVALLTPNSIGRPWILYEVGVARGKLGTPAFGLAVGSSLDQVSGPFAQFQNSGDDEDSLTKLVLQLIRRNPEAAPREEAVRRQVSAFRDRIQEVRPASEARQEVAPPDGATIAKLFEEVKVMFRALPDQLAMRVRREPVAEHVDPFAESDWIERGHALVWDTRKLDVEEVADRWRRFMMHLDERTHESLDVAVFDVWRALASNDMESLQAAKERYREFLARLSREGRDPAFFHMARHGLELLGEDHSPGQLFIPDIEKKRARKKPGPG